MDIPKQLQNGEHELVQVRGHELRERDIVRIPTVGFEIVESVRCLRDLDSGEIDSVALKVSRIDDSFLVPKDTLIEVGVGDFPVALDYNLDTRIYRVWYAYDSPNQEELRWTCYNEPSTKPLKKRIGLTMEGYVDARTFLSQRDTRDILVSMAKNYQNPQSDNDSGFEKNFPMFDDWRKVEDECLRRWSTWAKGDRS